MKILFLIVALTTPSWATDWTIGDKTYHNVVVGTVEADQVHITYDGGIGSLPLSSLPREVQKQLSYDPERAATAAQIRALQAQISDLTQQIGELRAAVARYKEVSEQAQPKPQSAPSIAAFHCYLYQTVDGIPTGYHGKGGLLSAGPYAGMSTGEATAAAQQAWATMPTSDKIAYEHEAQEKGDPITREDAIKAKTHFSTSTVVGDGDSATVNTISQ